MHIIEYSNLLLFNKHQKLLVANLIKDSQITTDQTRVYEEALNNFALQTWSDNRLANFYYSIVCRQWLAKVAIWIKSVELIQKELLLGCILCFSILDAYANTIINIIGLSV